MPPLIEFRGCETCTLKKEWPFLIHPKMPVAQPSAKSPYRVFIHGEAPGKTEDEFGRPFIGDAGTYLRKYIPQEWEKKLYWTNCVRCRPPKNRTPEMHEVRACSVFQNRDFQSIQPHAVLALGDVAIKYYWEDAWITGLRGIPFPAALPTGETFWVMSTFHPSYVMRQDRKDYDTGDTINTMLPVFKNDLAYFFDQVDWFANNPAVIYKPPKKEEILFPKTKAEAMNLFWRLKEPYAHDVETIKLRPYMRDARLLTASFSDGELTFAFPVDWPGASYSWGHEAYVEMMSTDRHWICQSGSMEYNWTWALTGKWNQHFEDTEAMARVVHKRKGVGKLANTSRIYLGIDIKKLHPELDKNNLLRHPLDEVLEYNAIDSWATRIIFDKLLVRMTQVDLDNYCRMITGIMSTVGMEKRGLDVNLAASEELNAQYSKEMAAIEEQARGIYEVHQYERDYNTTFKLSEAETVGNVLVKYCHINLPATEKGKQYSTSENDLQEYVKTCELVKVLLDYRELAKLLSTYVEPFISGALFAPDGLIHPQYTVLHTATYRLSSELPNIQNFPKRAHKEARKQIVPRKGYIFAAFDYGQLEGRVIAMFSQDKNLIKSFITEEDIHWKWLYRIIELYPEYMDRLARVSGEKDEKKVLKAGRTIIKTDFVFAAFYGAKAGSLANRTGLPLEIATHVTDEFWGTYPEAKLWVDGQFRLYNEKGYIQSLQGRIRNEVMGGNEPCNSPAQGSAAELVIDAQNALFLRAMEEENPNLMPRINIHDDLIFELPDDETLGDNIEEIGHEIVKPRHSYVTVPLVTEARVGYDWASLEAITIFKGDYFKTDASI